MLLIVRSQSLAITGSDCLRLVWVADGLSIGRAWSHMDAVHAVAPCVDLHVVHIGSGSNAVSRNENASVPQPFRRVVTEQCASLGQCPVLAALRGASDARTLVLVSAEPFCLAPAVLLLLEMLPDLRRRLDAPLTGFQLCQVREDDVKGADGILAQNAVPVLLLDPGHFLSAVDRAGDVSLARLISQAWLAMHLCEWMKAAQIADQPLHSLPAILNAPPPFAVCGDAECTFQPFRELHHVHARVLGFGPGSKRHSITTRRTTTSTPVAQVHASRVCTMVMTVYERHATVMDRLRFYESLPCLKSIVVVWNNMLVAPPKVERRRFNFPVTKAGGGGPVSGARVH